ncbi:unnamed protein product [Callosobruchus maculatus]|uniref:Uncharacterized protein n=1 Tax=Callosobruchus maculatus TaxID=64391 RepID=A0A653DBV0_CALMS|nr:unnamed protein product [Callosobruchus maculatus]
MSLMRKASSLLFGQVSRVLLRPRPPRPISSIAVDHESVDDMICRLHYSAIRSVS